jgi:threonine aldolase
MKMARDYNIPSARSLKKPQLIFEILKGRAEKNGLMFGEAIVVFNSKLVQQLHFIRKQGMQLASKMRFVAAQFATLFGTDLWHRNASHANALARELEGRLREINGVEIVYPVEANGVFARLPHGAISGIQEEMFFHVWDPEEAVVRLMLSFDSRAEDIDAFAAAVKRHLS